MELALGLDLELNTEIQAGPAYLGKKRENRPYTGKLAERETKDKALRGEVNRRSQKSTKGVTVDGVKSLLPMAKVESKLLETDELELHETVHEDRLRHLIPEEGLKRRYGADYRENHKVRHKGYPASDAVDP